MPTLIYDVPAVAASNRFIQKGPFYAGGALSVRVVVSPAPPSPEGAAEFAAALGIPLILPEPSVDQDATFGAKTTIGPQEVIEVRDLAPGSAHAVVVVGVNTTASTVYYKDPNGSHKVLVIGFAAFAAGGFAPRLKRHLIRPDCRSASIFSTGTPL